MARKRKPGRPRGSRNNIETLLQRAMADGNVQANQIAEHMQRLHRDVAGLATQFAALRMQVAGIGATLAGIEAERARLASK